jgi:DTW domain-containing protein YfiP
VAERCDRCLLLARLCLCGEVAPRPTRAEIVILRHVAERFRSSNTGRVAAMALAGARLVDFGDQDAPLDDADLAPPGTWLVFPEGPVVTPPTPPARLIFLDATWAQARRMRQRVHALRGLPILHLAVEPSAERMRRSPGAGRVSTIEAISAALRLCGEPAPAADLDRLFALHVDRARAAGRH